MKIAILGILGQKIQQDALGGTELFTYNLVSELSKKGYETTLFSTKDSKVNTKLIGSIKSKFFTDSNISKGEAQRRSSVMHLSLFSDFIKIQENFDLVHISTVEWYYFIPLLPFIKIPNVITVHSKLMADDDLKLLSQKYPEANLVFVSLSQKRIFPKFIKSFLVYNGITLDIFSLEGGDYLCWVGRMVKYKGIENLFTVTDKVNRKLIFGGSGENTDYFKNIIKPLIEKNKKTKFLGSLDFRKKNNLLKNAKIMLNPIQWEEPFGLVAVEAMSCGTPVIAFNRGAVPEIIKDGATGFICPPNDFNCIIKAVKKIYEMPEGQYRKMRQACRKHVEENFTVERMVDGYEKVYKKVIEDFKKKR